MITAINTLGQFGGINGGAGVWFAGWLVCVTAYFVILPMNKVNQRSGKNLLFWFLVAEVSTDLAWAVYYYINPGAIHYGVGLVYGLVPWLIVLSIAGVIATIQNKKANTK